MSFDIAHLAADAMTGLQTFFGPTIGNWFTATSATMSTWLSSGQQQLTTAMQAGVDASGPASAQLSQQLGSTATEVLKRPDVLGGMFLGICLSAACGFRVFVPPLVVCAAALFFGLKLPHTVAWMGTWAAFSAFSVAVILEMLAFYIPFFSHLLDVIAAPLTVIAGSLMTYTFLTGQIDPMWLWVLAIIAGGGSAAMVQASTSGSRVASTALTFGLANPLIATLENLMAVGLSVGSFAVPAIAVVIGGGILLIGIPVLSFFLIKRFIFAKKTAQPTTAPIETHGQGVGV